MDKYSLISCIGVGSYGRVYQACTNDEEKKVVAVKVILKRSRSEKEIVNFRQECKIQSKLKHANIIEMFESFETSNNELVIVTEFFSIDLHKFLSKNGSINEEKAQILTCQLISALHYLHSQRVLHRDLKPQNVLLNEEFHVKLCDFGLARNMTMSTHVLTSIKGTPLYMAPELLAGKPYDHEADFWSLGCIIYESLVGQTPFYTTSIFQLLRLIRREEVKWPSFISNDCTSFLHGLLEKDPLFRITWAQILCHPFVEYKLNIVEDSNSKKVLKSFTEKHEHSIRRNNSENLTVLSLSENLEENVSSSRDSVNAVLQSDLENIETDAEELNNHVIPFSESIPYKTNNNSINGIIHNVVQSNTEIQDNALLISGNPNLIVMHMNDNFNNENIEQPKPKSAILNWNTKMSSSAKSQISNGKHNNHHHHNARNKDLEKRKLSQNLDNFSLRLGQSYDDEICKKLNESIGDKKKIKTISNDEKLNNSENNPPCLPPGWDSCDESQSPPIENDEWLAFLNRSMQEVLDGDLDSLQQQNLVSIIVAPLRNTKASSDVIESVAKLLSFPLVLGGPSTTLDLIKNIYVDIKLVPNLMYASKLLTNTKNMTDSASTINSTSSLSLNNNKTKYFTELTNQEIKTISNLYELVCYLVHLNESFLTQFCDAVAILAADELLINFLTHDFTNSESTRISNNVIALFCCVLRELPENAELVEKIIFNPKLNLISLINSPNSILRSRICMLFRLLGRFSLLSLQNIWSSQIKEAFEKLLFDEIDLVRTVH